MSFPELNRKLNNLISIGTVTESKSAEGLSLARVKILDRVTDFFPVIGVSNSFKTQATPIKVGEQVLIFCPFGNADSGIIFGSIFNKTQKEPVEYSDTKEVTEYSDGTTVSYDSKTHEMKINGGDLKVSIVAKSVGIVSDTLSIASDVNISGPLHVTDDISTDSSISDSLGSLTGHIHQGVTPGGSNTGTRP